MTMMQSEQWFEEFCNKSNLRFERIETSTKKTPDYTISIGDEIIIAEIKELVPNEDEMQSIELTKARGYGIILSITPGERVRNKIKRASAQIKARAQGKYPSILVLCDIRHGLGQIAMHLDPYSIKVGMYGLEQVHMSVPKDPNISPYITGMGHGPRRMMTEGHNTTISAIWVLSTPSQDEVCFDIYHNKYASRPLDPSLLADLSIHQFHIVEQSIDTASYWQEFNMGENECG